MKRISLKSRFKIKSVFARQIFTRQEFSGLGMPAIETTVTTEDRTSGSAVVMAGFSVGKHEIQYIFDGGTSWGGLGVTKAVSNVNEIINPAIKGMDVTRQGEVDKTLIELDGTPEKSKLGGNTIASVSTAALKTGALSLEIPIYRYIGGINATTLPVPGIICVDGSDRYVDREESGGKPSYAFTCYGFKSFSEASYACWELLRELRQIITKKIKSKFQSFPFRIASGQIEHDKELWDSMTEAIENLGYKNRVGLQVDIAASTYYDREKQKFFGLFSEKPKTREDLIELYKEMTKSYPFIILEDPLDEDDFEGHTLLTRELDIEIVGDDLFVTNASRLQRGIEAGSCNTILIKPPQIGTISETLSVVRLATQNGYGVMPCGSRGESSDIADYAVGLNTGQIREGGLGPTANRLLAIEAELGNRARFLGKTALKISK